MDNAEQVAAAAAEAQGGSAKEAVADAAKQAAESTSEEQATLLGQEEEGQKEGAVAPAAKVVPEKYEFKVPEGVTIDNQALEKFTPIFKEVGLSQADAQKLVDVYAPYIQQQAEAQREEAIKVFKDMVNEWGENAKKELGPDYAKKLAVASKVIDKSGVPGIRELMNETGVGNHPAMVKFMLWVGEQFSQDTLADSTTKKSDSGEEAIAKKLYPTMNQ